MELKIRMALLTNEFALEPIIETECRFKIDDDQSLYHLEKLFHFVVVQKLQKQETRLRGIKDAYSGASRHLILFESAT